MRLLSSDANPPYIGRLEVFHSGQWGAVCDDSFSTPEANQACVSLNYTDGAVCYATRGFPISSGKEITHTHQMTHSFGITKFLL